MQLYLRLLKYLRPYWVRLAVAVVCSGLVAAFTSTYAWLVRPVLDEVFINRNVTWLALLPVALIVVSSLKGVADRKSTRLNSSHVRISYAVFCLKKKKRSQFNHRMRRDSAVRLRHSE